MDTITLWFSNPAEPFLSRTEYTIHSSGTKLVAIRGKTSSAFGSVGTFQWTSAVQAMTVIMLQTALCKHTHTDERSYISGDKGTLAASLDYCISKSPCWLLDMFGTDTKGMTRTRRLFLRNNPERKRGGEVTIAINQNILEPQNIRCILQGQEVTNPELLRNLIAQIERSAVYTRRAIADAENVTFEYLRAA
jgi:hypothetical protein